MCGQLHCTSTSQKLLSFISSLIYHYSNSYVTNGSAQYSCGSIVLDVGMQQQDPGLAPNGAKCGNGMVLELLLFDT